MNFKLAEAIEILEQTPATVKSLLGNLSDEWTLNKNTGEWSPFDVIGHYIHGEETDWIPRAEIILAQGENRTFEPFDRFAQFEISKGKNLSELLETFAELRRKSLKTLKSWNLSDEQLQLKGTHPELGEVTLEQLLSTWMVHDLTHIRQIVQILAKNYAENVGEWKAYLSILQ
ncbi:MAG TPA: DinB family protein [Pyrinomonadaceae bacterium]|nr:DinB family protein [Pyrinomonadaceae bacterium]